MSAADNETVAQQLPRVLDDAYKTLTDARAALESAAKAHAGAVHAHTEALSAARAAGLVGAVDADARVLDERNAERREHVTSGEERCAKEAYRDAIVSLEDSTSKARRWLADARAGGASAESVTAAESAIGTAERRAYVERLTADERGWIRRAKPTAEARAAAPVESLKISGTDAASTTDTPRKKRHGPKQPKIAIIDGVEFVVGIDSMVLVLQAEDVGCRPQTIVDALNKNGGIVGAVTFGEGTNPPWAVPRRALVAWGLARRNLPVAP